MCLVKVEHTGLEQTYDKHDIDKKELKVDLVHKIAYRGMV